MAFFGAVRAAIADNRRVRCPRFVDFDFTSGNKRVWEGVGRIQMNGASWDGLGELGSISDIAVGIGDAAGSVTFTLSGVSDEVIAAAKDQADEVRNRDVFVLGHFIDLDTWALLDSPFAIWAGIMDRLGYSGVGPGQRTVSLVAETIWTAGNAAAYAYYSDRDQQARFAGDEGLERVSMYAPGVKRRWPIF